MKQKKLYKNPKRRLCPCCYDWRWMDRYIEKNLSRQIDLEPEFMEALNDVTLQEGKDFPSRVRIT